MFVFICVCLHTSMFACICGSMLACLDCLSLWWIIVKTFMEAFGYPPINIVLKKCLFYLILILIALHFSVSS